MSTLSCMRPTSSYSMETRSAVDGHEDGCDQQHEGAVEEELIDQGHGDLDDGHVQ